MDQVESTGPAPLASGPAPSTTAPASAVEPAPLTRLRRRRAPRPSTVLAVASVGVFVAFVDATIVNIAFPSIERSFPRTSISGISWVLSAYNIVFAAFLVAAGRIADLVGRRRVFTAALACFTLASALCAVAPSIGTLVAARLLQALGAAFLIPSSLALVLATFGSERRSHAVALWTAVAAAAAGVGPSLGGLLLSASNWRLVFLVNLPIGIAGIALTRRLLVESRAPGRRRLPDLLGALVFAVATGLLVLGIVEGQDWGWTSARVLGSFAAAAVLGVWFVARCASHRDPLVDLSLLRIRNFTLANAMTVVGAAGFFGYTLCNVLFLTTVWRYSLLQAGLALTPGPVVAVAVAGPASRLAERFGTRVVAGPGGVIWGAAVLWMVHRVGVAPDFVGQWLPGMALLGLGAGAASPTVSGAAVAAAPGDRFATATALNSVARQVGAALGIAAVVSLIGHPTAAGAFAAFHHAWTFAAICLIAMGLTALGLERRNSSAAPDALPSFGRAARAVRSAVAPPTHAQHDGHGAARPRATESRILEHRPETMSDFLGGVPLFADLDEPLRDALAQHARQLHLVAGEWLFREGEAGHCLYVVRAGRLEVVAGDGTLLWVAGRGAAIGELALLTGSPRAASVRAARASDLITVDRADFEDLLERAPKLSRALNRSLAAQLRVSRGAVEQTRPRPVTVAVVPMQRDLPVDAIVRGLVVALERYGRAVSLGGSEIPVASPGEFLSSYAPLLDRREAKNDQVILRARDPFAGDPWTTLCLQQADRVLVVTAGGPVPDGLDRFPELRGCDLVGHAVAPGSGELAGWCERLDPVETHALGRGDRFAQDLERVARRLAGRSIGLVLSGGGARAFSHIGVLEELRAAGVVIDRVAGVSMGAYVGALLAMGLEPEEIDARCYEEWVRRRPLGDYTLPRHALIRGERVRAMLARTFGDVCIEELASSFFCASADLRSSELVVHRHGLLREHVGTSMALPIIGPPQPRGRRLLIDGSLVDNLPVATMAWHREGPIIAVDVRSTFAGLVDAALAQRDTATGTPARESRTPLLGETLTRVLLMASANTSEAARRHADLVIRPRNHGVGLLEFHQLDAAREAGAVAAREALAQAPEWLFE